MTEDRSVMSFFPHPGFNSRKRLSPVFFFILEKRAIVPGEEKKARGGRQGKREGNRRKPATFRDLINIVVRTMHTEN